MNAVKSLYELTGQESGIVVFFGSEPPEAIVTNWASIPGLPRLSPLGGPPVGLGESIEMHEAETCENVPGFLDGVRVIFSNGEEMPTRARLFDIPEHDAAVLCPEGWA